MSFNQIIQIFLWIFSKRLFAKNFTSLRLMANSIIARWLASNITNQTYKNTINISFIRSFAASSTGLLNRKKSLKTFPRVKKQKSFMRFNMQAWKKIAKSKT